MGNNKKLVEAIKVETVEVGITLEELISIGMEIREKFDNNSWSLGDLAIKVTENLGPEGLVSVAQKIGIEIGTFRRYRDVAKKYSPEMREAFRKLSWSHFKAVAPREDRYTILERADLEEWTIEQMYKMIQPDKTKVIDDGKFVPARPEMKFCLVCRKWYVANPKEVCPSGGQCMEVK